MEHMLKHPKETKPYPSTLGMFWGTLILPRVKLRRCPMIGAILEEGLPDAFHRIDPMSYEEAVRYWTRPEGDGDEDGRQSGRADETPVNSKHQMKEMGTRCK
jgi:hypothetical protein